MTIFVAEPEMHDCHELARCVNLFGGYACQGRHGYRGGGVTGWHRWIGPGNAADLEFIARNRPFLREFFGQWWVF